MRLLCSMLPLTMPAAVLGTRGCTSTLMPGVNHAMFAFCARLEFVNPECASQRRRTPWRRCAAACEPNYRERGITAGLGKKWRTKHAPGAHWACEGGLTRCPCEGRPRPAAPSYCGCSLRTQCPPLERSVLRAFQARTRAARLGRSLPKHFKALPSVCFHNSPVGIRISAAT